MSKRLNPLPASTRASTLRRALASTLITFAIGFAGFLAIDGPAVADPVPTATTTSTPADTTASPAAASTPAAVPDAAAAPVKPAPKSNAPKSFGEWVERFSPILIILLVIGFVLARLPKVELGHSPAFRRRRVLNWLPLGLTYAFLYMGRYNLNVAKVALGDILPLQDFALIFGVGTVVYGFAFLINGPLTDRIGGKKAMLIGSIGSLIANLGMGIVTAAAYADPAGVAPGSLTPAFVALYAINMYFQSFGAVAIVKVNAPWFHVRERGVFGAIFGILISLGVYFAYDWSDIIVSLAPVEWVFFIPTILITVFVVLDIIFVRNSPAEAGLTDFDTGDASSGDDGPRMPVLQVFKMMLTNPIILTIAFIEFCSGYLRQAIMQLYRPYAAAIADPDPLITWASQNWGVILCAAGILGGTVAGVISDRIFGSRRGPVAAVLYGLMFVGGGVAVALLGTPGLGLLFGILSIFIIGVHGMLSGTASMDFGGRKNAGIAVGIIDGFVYLGTAVMSLTNGLLLPSKTDLDPLTGVRLDADPANWIMWPVMMLPIALIGFVLSLRIWNAKPKPKGASAH